MASTNIYKDIAERTGGDIYIGVVGPVRTGKSTFIKKFCELMVIPNAPHDFSRERMIDELPQSAAGRTIMTTEPKFVPERGVRISVDNNIEMNVRLVDCVGYIVPSSLGYIENEEPRMVKTPWFEDEIPFNMAAEIGTKKVISEHATIGLVITTDASISDIPREEYEEAEERVINELKELNKPFVVLLNCMYPKSASAGIIAGELSEKYDVPVLPVNCLNLTEEEMNDILTQVLYEFPLRKIVVNMPSWLKGCDKDSELHERLNDCFRKAGNSVTRISDLQRFTESLLSEKLFSKAVTEGVELGVGCAYIDAGLDNTYFYNILSGITGEEIKNDADLIDILKDFSVIKKKYEKIAAALEQVDSTGYGIVMPSIDELSLEEPEIMRQGSRYGVRLKASAPSIHLMKADIKTEVAPIVGSEKQSEDLIKYLLDGFEDDPSKIWESNIFGKSLDELVNEGLKTKLMHMPNEARMKLQQTLERVINEGCNGLICIIV
ncbi:MAG: stage IV sporulation protein A [Clostridia bacterium]|nr:stage IV sporulation protein A [Clostridia bacterium]